MATCFQMSSQIILFFDYIAFCVLHVSLTRSDLFRSSATTQEAITITTNTAAKMPTLCLSQMPLMSDDDLASELACVSSETWNLPLICMLDEISVKSLRRYSESSKSFGTCQRYVMIPKNWYLHERSNHSRISP